MPADDTALTAPLVLLQHFRGNLDNWDPLLVDTLAATDRLRLTYSGEGSNVAATGTLRRQHDHLFR
ncbi:MAG TPA: hypothetical protein VGS06_33200 [Streptosporangiaceae bacterium]|nr:hypothetical protein [Streptosporangiaceae bacterium]